MPSYTLIDDIFGSGYDGIVTISSSQDLSRDMYYDSLTVDSTLKTKGYRIFVKNTLTVNGTIHNNGTDGGDTGGAGGGAAGTAPSTGTVGRGTAGTGGVGG